MPKEVRESDFTAPVKQYKDIDLCFRRNPVTGDIAVKENENAIKQALKNLMLTRPGEKPFSPNVGSTIQDLLFEPLDQFTADRLEIEILSNIAQFDARIEVTDVEIRPSMRENGFICRLDFRIFGSPVVQEVDFVLQRPD